MLIVFGTRPTTISRFTHQWEGDSSPTEYTVMGRYFHIMFLALFPTRKFVIVREPGGREYGIDPNNEQFVKLAASKGAKTGFGLRPWWGWLVILGVFLIFSIKSCIRGTSDSESTMSSGSEQLEEKLGMAESADAAAEDDTTGQAAAIQASIDLAVRRVGTLQEGELLAVMFPGNELPFVVYLVKKKKGDTFTLLESAYGWDDYSQAAGSAEAQEYKEDEDYWEEGQVTRTRTELLQMAKAGSDDWDKEKGILMAVFPMNEE